ALMQRVARLLRDGTTASRIMVCTFTRTAARDLEGAYKQKKLALTVNLFCAKINLPYELYWNFTV
ncbi:MAG: hypothetical protein M1511_04880, partial [Deltaproteobacteria bacterium]|nr:hypothetical protein [Deltaproteobacteria bacterium]